MDYLYGKLNETVKKTTYQGGVTDTAVVDIINNKIYVSSFYTPNDYDYEKIAQKIIDKYENAEEMRF